MEPQSLACALQYRGLLVSVGLVVAQQLTACRCVVDHFLRLILRIKLLNLLPLILSMAFESDSGSSDFSLADPLELDGATTLLDMLGISLRLEDELDEAPPEADDDPLEPDDEPVEGLT